MFEILSFVCCNLTQLDQSKVECPEYRWFSEDGHGMPLIAIYNPVCGDGTAKQFFDSHVLPLLQSHRRVPDKVVATESAEHAGIALADFLESAPGDVTVILSSGDGTLHDIINHLSSNPLKGARAKTPLSLNLALVPCGTANALYSSYFPPGSDPDQNVYKLQSVQAFIDSSGTIPLSLGTTVISSPSRPPTVTLSAVVISTALHALILRDSESLRQEIPGIGRFKVAAQQNILRWYYGRVKLSPVSSVGTVQIYDPSKQDFILHEESRSSNQIIDLNGPFAYFLSTVNVDRLEPAFRIAPLQRLLPTSYDSIDIVVVRPLRDPFISADTSDARTSFVARATTVLTGAYRNGAHINMRYGSDGQIVVDGEGPTVVEYFRCGGWEWIPDASDESAHVLCADGTIFNIESEGSASCSAATANIRFSVHIKQE